MNYVCTEKCFHSGKLYRKGELLRKGHEPPRADKDIVNARGVIIAKKGDIRHFEPVGGEPVGREAQQVSVNGKK